MYPVKKKSGFTLIELLVVISIIAILMAIMMPALSAARDQARRILCGSNSRSIGMATAQFAVDNDNWLPTYDGFLANADNSPYKGLWPHKGFWYADIATYLDYGTSYSDYLDRGKAGNSKQASEKGYAAPEILSCPSLAISETNGITSLAFGWNWTHAGYRFASDSYKNTHWWRPRRVTQIHNASQSAILGENRWDVTITYAWGGNAWAAGNQSDMGKYYYGQRHRGGGHYVAADGHIEFAQYEDLVKDYNDGGLITIIRPTRR